MNLLHARNCNIIGLHHFVKCSVTTPEAFDIYHAIQKLINSADYNLREFKRLHKKLEKFVNRRKTYKNLIVTSGRNVIRDAIGDNTFSGSTLINYGALGDGTAGADLTDTQLGNETNRKVITSYDATVDHVIDVLTFWNLAEANQQHYEAGEFINGTGAANSGTIFARWQIDELKQATETLSIQSQYTLTQT